MTEEICMRKQICVLRIHDQSTLLSRQLDMGYIVM